MKDLLWQLSAYHIWANERLIKATKPLPEATLHKDTGSSFGSIYNTFLHLADAENIWWQRLQGIENAVFPSHENIISFEELASRLLQQNEALKNFITTTDTKGFEKVLNYCNTKGEAFSQPVYQILIHLFNHATYHRGQIVTALRGFNVSQIPATDFIVWSRQ